MKKLIYILFLFSATIYGQTTTTTVGSLKLNNQPSTATGNQYQLVRNPVTKFVEQQLITGGGGGGIDHAKGNYNALNNIPALANGTGVRGDYYTVTFAGTQFGYDFKLQDRIEYNGVDWVKVIDNNAGLSTILGINNIANNQITLTDGIGLYSTMGIGGFQTGDYKLELTDGYNFFNAPYSRNSLRGSFNSAGLIMKTSRALNDITSTYKNDNITGSATFQAPNTASGEFTQPISVGGRFADINGNIPDATGGGTTNISYTPSLRQINSSTGTGAVLPIANGTNYGLSINDYTTAERDKLATLPDSYFDGAYSSLIGVPSTFAPSAHNHIIGDVTGLQPALDSKQSQLNGTGFVKQNGLTTTYDNSTYLTGITSGNVTTALGFTPYNATNPNGYINSVPAQSFASLTGKPTTLGGYGITDAYPLTGNPSNFITSSALSPYLTSALASTTYQPIGSYLTSETDPLALKKASNLSDLTNVTTARTNLGLGTLSTQNGTVSGTNTGDNSPNTLYSGLVSNATHTGDVSGSTVLTLASVNSQVGAFSGFDTTLGLTLDAKGRVTNLVTNQIQIAQSQVTTLVSDLASKQATLVSGTNIKTVNGESVLGSTNIVVAIPNANTTGTASNITGVLPQGQVAGLTASLNNLVPYSGANQNLVMGLNDVSTNKIVISKTSNPFLQYISPGISEWSSGLNSTSSDYVISASNGLTIPKLELSQSGNLKIYGNITATSLITGTTSISDNQLNSSVGANLFPTTSGRLVNTTDLATKAGTQITEIFTANGTWTKPAGAKAVSITIIGGGGGAGSGRKGASATIRCAGGAGAGGGISKNVFDATDLTATVSITVGTSGVGGASQATNSTNGNNGTAGGQSSFGFYLRAIGGGLGQGGTSTTGTAGGAGAGLSSSGASGVSASTTGLAGANANANSLYGEPSGATGGGITSANVASAGGSGNVVPTYSNQTLPATNSGAINTSATNGATPQSSDYGFGGGGGGSSLTGNGGNGGNGSGYGAGGGSGGASVDAVGNSGAGGNGAPGVVIVKTYF
ncbi:beta strand repeat-containing protein [Flavobacterium sp.]|uniref:beta strand repeat-containing protein n=1 Tax=Flavobacterium sp. TaxID=239 RepID=UPI0037535756